ncbi:uncharacterized protein PAC_02520 [Phialocephala subalpina]|uniref:2EXR domain-containing protein n=1 Tax=Phialocephala subalpina TaxID=576137 RepID=A0A1L7WIN7_9HELO|nr:uncharacterized protein PAC_02520 [Phialocephala subalpina]
MPPNTNRSCRRLRLGPRSFKLFPKLPFDIRVVIYIMALPDGQPIIIKEEWHIVNHMKCIAKEAAAYYKVPALLHTSSEARIAAQKIYKKCFEVNLCGNNGVWMDLDRDILCISGEIGLTTSLAFFGNAQGSWDGYMDHIHPAVTIKEKLPMIAFQRWPSQYGVSPTTLEMMGKPEKIYMVRYSGAPTRHQLNMKSAKVPTGWQGGAGDAFQYPQPDVETLTYRTLREKLSELGGAVIKRKTAEAEVEAEAEEVPSRP